MSKPQRHSSAKNIAGGQRTFFVTTSTDRKRPILQTRHAATLLIDVMFHYRDQGEYKLHDFVVMRNHFHAQLTLGMGKSIERAVQLIKGGFSYRARRELSIKQSIWQRGFSEDRVESREEFLAFRRYIYQNPVRAGLVDSPEQYLYSSAHPRFKKARTMTAKNGQE